MNENRFTETVTSVKQKRNQYTVTNTLLFPFFVIKSMPHFAFSFHVQCQMIDSRELYNTRERLLFYTPRKTLYHPNTIEINYEHDYIITSSFGQCINIYINICVFYGIKHA